MYLIFNYQCYMHVSKNEEAEESFDITFLTYHLIVPVFCVNYNIFLQMKITGKKVSSYLFSYGQIRADIILNGLNHKRKTRKV